jgi:Mor family transcriptional regulator
VDYNCFVSGVSDRIKENFIKNICEAAILTSLHPRTAINVVIQEMQDCGGVSTYVCQPVILSKLIQWNVDNSNFCKSKSLI